MLIETRLCREGAKRLRTKNDFPQIGPDSRHQVSVNESVCRRLAAFLKNRSIPEEREDVPVSSLALSDIGNFYFLLVAICHQTSPQGKAPLEGTVGGRYLKGWDYLSAKLLEAVTKDSALLTPAAWVGISESTVRGIFRDEVIGERLSDPAGRTLLINDLGQKMLAQSWESANDIYTSTNGRIASGDPSILDLMGRFRAYSDPVRKKTWLFLALMRNMGLWKFVDPANLGPPVDYHEIRGHLRIGTVEVFDPELRSILVKGERVNGHQDIIIRQAVSDAIMLISELSGLNDPSRLHYLFWNIFRSCCTRSEPHCHACPPTCSLPPQYVPLATLGRLTRRCPFSDVCNSANDQVKLLEPLVETEYY